MSFRRNVIDALNHKQTALSPWAFEMTEGFADSYKAKFPGRDAAADLESNILFGKYKKMKWLDESTYQDVFGVQWRLGADGGDIGTPVNKLVSLDDVESYTFPDIDGAELEKGLSAMREDTEHFRSFRMTYTMFERAWSLAGMSEFLMEMALDEGNALRLLERVAEYQHRLLDRVLDEDFEGVYFGDDWGTQAGLIMGPDYFRRFIKPFMRELCERVHSKGKYVLLHCCGNIEAILPDIIEIGINAYNTVQPEIYDLGKIKREFGADITFWGAMSTQQFLPSHTSDEVFEKSVETIRLLGSGGGYIFSPTHALTPDIPPENAIAMLEAVKSIEWN